MMVRWVVQSNLGGQYVGPMREACLALGHEFVSHTHVPFSENISDVPNDKPTIFYGATRFIDMVYRNNKWNPGVYFSPESVYPFWSDKYGVNSLNSPLHSTVQITTLEDLSKMNYKGDHELFIRPCDDMKAFAGDVMPFGKIKKWAEVLVSDVMGLGTLPIVVAEPVGLAKEWRLIILEGKVIASSQYRGYMNLRVNSEVPSGVAEFGELMAEIYSPAPLFVMDIGQSRYTYYVIEVGCFNSAGFYACDIHEVVKKVSEYIEFSERNRVFRSKG